MSIFNDLRKMMKSIDSEREKINIALRKSDEQAEYKSQKKVREDFRKIKNDFEKNGKCGISPNLIIAQNTGKITKEQFDAMVIEEQELFKKNLYAIDEANVTIEQLINLIKRGNNLI